MSAHKKDQLGVAALLLYGVSFFGLISLFATSHITGFFTPLVWVDIAVYVVLFLLAVWVRFGSHIARWLYLVGVIAWLVALIGFLPRLYGHSLDSYTVFIQIILVIAAYYLLLASHREPKGAH